MTSEDDMQFHCNDLCDIHIAPPNSRDKAWKAFWICPNKSCSYRSFIGTLAIKDIFALIDDGVDVGFSRAWVEENSRDRRRRPPRVHRTRTTPSVEFSYTPPKKQRARPVPIEERPPWRR